MPQRINTAVIQIQTFLRGCFVYKHVRTSLTYRQLMTWSRLHRNSLHRQAADRQHAIDHQLGLNVAKLQAVYRGWRGRGKARYVKHRVWSAATLVLQTHLIRPYLAQKQVKQLRSSVKWMRMGAKMNTVRQIQLWYRGRREGRMARIVLMVLKQNRHRLAVIKRMSETYSFHICSTGLWNAKKQYAQQAQQLQWATKYATMVQSVIRAWGAKKIIEKLRTARIRRERRRQHSSIRIQALFRGFRKRGEVVKRAYFVVQEAARRRWVVRASDDVHRTEILHNEQKEKLLMKQNDNNKKLRANVMKYTIQETPLVGRQREQKRDRVVPDSVRQWYDGPHFTTEELFEKSEDNCSMHHSSSASESESESESPRYW